MAGGHRRAGLNLAMRIVVLIILSFLVTWLIAHLDHRATFLQMLFDWEALVVGMLVSAAILYIVYQILQNVFGGL